MKNRMIFVTTLCCVIVCTPLVNAEDKKTGTNEQVTTIDMVSDAISTDATIRFVEPFAVMGEGEPGQEERKEIERKRDLATTEIQEESKKLEKAKNEYVSKSSAMSDKAREAEEKKLMKMERDLKNMIAEKEEELKHEMQIATEKLAQDMEIAVIELAQQENIDIVFDKMSGRAIYVSDAFDITDKVITRVNKRHQIKLAENKKNSSKKTEVSA
jgi:Skp family chaperone for outer membrane proteins